MILFVLQIDLVLLYLANFKLLISRLILVLLFISVLFIYFLFVCFNIILSNIVLYNEIDTSVNMGEYGRTPLHD